MQMPDKWEDPYVFVEDFYAHFAGERRRTMYDAAETMMRLFGLDCQGTQIGRRGKVSYQTLKAWLEAAGDEDEWAFDDLLPHDPAMLPWGFAEWFAEGSDASLDIVKRRAEEFADFATGAIGREGLRICCYPEPDLHAYIRMREWLCWESNCTALFARKPNRLRKGPVQVVKLDCPKALSRNYQTSIKETR